MMSIDALRAYGANVDEGLGRCFNDESFYLKMVDLGLTDANFERLKAAMAAGDAKLAFDAAHALKGVAGNLSLTPIYAPACTLTELLREGGQTADGEPLLSEILAQLTRARAL